jgi:hypothetical protein
LLAQLSQDGQRLLRVVAERAAPACKARGIDRPNGPTFNQTNLEEAILGSTEFYNLGGGTDLGFANRRFQTVLNRLPSTSEINSVLAVLGDPPLNASSATALVTLHLPPLNLNLLGLQVQTNDITVNVSAQPGSGQLLGNLLTTVSGLLNLKGVNTALNTVLGNVVTLLNSSQLYVSGVNTSTGPLNTAAAATTPVLDLSVAPVHVNLLGLVVTTSNIQAQLLAQTGDGQVLGNLLYNTANLLNPGGAPSLLAILNDLGL